MPVLFMAALGNGIYRKPSLGMFQYLENKYQTVNRESSFYCGDAAGRKANSDKAKDFSDDDLKFS